MLPSQVANLLWNPVNVAESVPCYDLTTDKPSVHQSSSEPVLPHAPPNPEVLTLVSKIFADFSLPGETVIDLCNSDGDGALQPPLVHSVGEPELMSKKKRSHSEMEPPSPGRKRRDKLESNIDTKPFMKFPDRAKLPTIEPEKLSLGKDWKKSWNSPKWTFVKCQKVASS